MIRSSVFGFVTILLVFSVNYEQANGQFFFNNNDTPLQMWLNVGRAVADDAVQLIGNLPLPFLNNNNNPQPAVPALPTVNVLPAARALPASPPVPRIVLIGGKPFITFDPAPATAPAPAIINFPNQINLPDPIISAVNAIEHPLATLLNILQKAPAAPSPPFVFPPTVRPPLPECHQGPCNSGCGCKPNKPCQPERVRIVVVDDCDKKKSSSEESRSGSSESKSDEVDVFVPRHGRKTINYRVRN